MDVMEDIVTEGFKPCSSIMVSGSTGSGKTMWIKKYMENMEYLYKGKQPTEILYCYGVYQPLYDEMKEIPSINIFFHEGVPSSDEIMDFAEAGVHKLIVLDDISQQALQSADIELLFTQYCHHKCLSCIFVQQNLFQQGKYSKTIAMNCWYLVLFENVRDKMQISYLGRQIFPGKNKAFMNVYKDATKKPYSYLLIDFSPNVQDKYRLRSGIFPSDKHYAYDI